jgi:hypothetical protein
VTDALQRPLLSFAWTSLYPEDVTAPREPAGDPFWAPGLAFRGWRGEALRRRGPNEFRIVTRMPNGIRVSIPLGPFRVHAKP